MSAVTGDRLQGFRGERRGSMPMGRLGWEGIWGDGGRDKEDMVMLFGGVYRIREGEKVCHAGL